mmetsp:Transcript_11182/g.14715  ORF Transcript_11182/g.14715 Transcript_11182/m.14715 type:complete len:135 (+) Transcript_11182:53-457(+)
MKSYAFILDTSSLHNPFLVEVSKQTKITWRHLAFYQPNVVKCSRAVAPILRCTLEDDLVFNQFRDLLNETILNCLLDDPGVSRQHTQDIVVASIVCPQAKRLLSSGVLLLLLGVYTTIKPALDQEQEVNTKRLN